MRSSRDMVHLFCLLQKVYLHWLTILLFLARHGRGRQHGELPAVLGLRRQVHTQKEGQRKTPHASLLQPNLFKKKLKKR